MKNFVSLVRQKISRLSIKEVYNEQKKSNGIERRYAFVYFVKAEEAEMARSTLTKLSKWKGNISFAKKEKDASERKSKNSVS